MHKAEHSSWNISVPSKVFLLGEYAILAGKPAILATLKPRFSLSLNLQSDQEFVDRLEGKGSPVDRLRVWALDRGARVVGGEFLDPFSGRGGFGASSAKFGLTYRAIVEKMNWNEKRWDQVWGLFRELLETSEDHSLLPSGADLVAQWCGGVTFFDPSQWKVEKLESTSYHHPKIFSGFVTFSATEMEGQKVVTHHHLRDLSDQGFPKSYLKYILNLNDIVHLGKKALNEGDLKLFGFCMNRYAQLLSEEGLENPKTRQMRETLTQCPGVLGVKGAGAMQSDAMIVLLNPEDESFQQDLQRVIQKGEALGLTHVQTGFFQEKGIEFEETLRSVQ